MNASEPPRQSRGPRRFRSGQRRVCSLQAKNATKQQRLRDGEIQRMKLSMSEFNEMIERYRCGSVVHECDERVCANASARECFEASLEDNGANGVQQVLCINVDRVDSLLSREFASRTRKSSTANLLCTKLSISV